MVDLFTDLVALFFIYIYIFYLFLFVSVYVYVSLCDFVCIALLLPFVLRLSAVFFVFLVFF